MSTLLAKKYFYVRKVTRARAPTVISPELSKGIYDLNYQMQTVREGPVDDEAKTREILDARNALRKALELASLAPLDR
ncbi:hypothetical protein A2272_01315 [Candidatus Peregrinibacteria bacterium RIFOXYA12_FULL_33_12]|nr:MAG: hypothetical protein A2272_01315 [Candidatus Peregrinibacteria bacterium RIFOXYA12_FULL_33_12]OGJ44167.1 MAG: hypothetical protein A2263_04285 [Candidatus Peregrinibacteria bacterium RIFOXYA2_FULL_33_21]OGJ51796.1 MAG: hypothetical protein A2307_04950 [Candidatus Peregrinibacteria bacterium RIFOXYB2_FULL_33_20]